MEDPIVILETLLVSRSDEVAETLQAACAAVRKAAPEACEHIFETYVIGCLFTFTRKAGGAFCHPVAYANHVNLGFNRGAELDDPDGLLEGTGKLIRHVRIEDSALLRKRGVQKLIKQAVAQGIAMAELRGGIVPHRATSPESRAKVETGAKKPARKPARKIAKQAKKRRRKR